jgi:hypothetical protein
VEVANDADHPEADWGEAGFLTDAA